jgi:predicted PolB exonuclease-like 3'-5' exonuclease
VSEHVIVFDLETVPDVQAGARIHGCADKSEAVVRELLGDKFQKLPLHKIVCIGAVVAERVEGVFLVHAIGAPHLGERTEPELITTFVDKVAAYRPQLVTFNGNSFDLPVLRYRAMMHLISAPGLDCRPYFKRYADDCIDLCSLLTTADPR